MSGSLLLAPRSLLSAVLLFSIAATSGRARLGETFDTMKERMGKPAPQARKDPRSAVWYFEVPDGQVVYNVTFNEKGESIAEGLKPVKNGMFTRVIVQDFIDGQLAPYRGSKTTHSVSPGQQYEFGGKSYVCGEKEEVVVDDPNGILIVWTKSGIPSVIAVRPELMQ